MGKAARRKRDRRKEMQESLICPAKIDYRMRSRVILSLMVVCAVVIVAIIFLQSSQKRNESTDLASTVTETIRDTPAIANKMETFQEIRNRARVRLFELMKNHPAEEIRVDFVRRLESGEIHLAVEPRIPGGAASTAYVVKARVKGSEEVKLIFGVKIEFLLDPNLSDAYKQITIYHEYQHILQRETEQYSHQEYKGESYITPDDVHGREYMTSYFMAEFDAVQKECDFALALGWESLRYRCEEYKRGGFAALRRYLANVLSQTLTGYSTEDRRTLAQLGSL